jgi:ADP-heptose:LPS heptosyltransferase
VGYESYQYRRLHNHLAPPSPSLWAREKTHSVEQQLALLGWTGVPVTDRPPTQLVVTEEADGAISSRLQAAGLEETSFAIIHPAAAFDTKQWATDKFARAAEEIAERGLAIVAITASNEKQLADELIEQANVRIVAFSDLSLPEVTALLSRARLFVGNDNGIAHMAAAVETPSVVIFGSSNIAHWRPWAKAPAEIVFEEMECQPCHGYFCEKFAEPECIKRVPVGRVMAAIERVLRQAARIRKSL